MHRLKVRSARILERKRHRWWSSDTNDKTAYESFVSNDDLPLLQPWLRAHGIAPEETCAHTVVGNKLHATVYLTSQDGRRYLDPADPHHPATKVVVVPLQQLPPFKAHNR